MGDKSDNATAPAGENVGAALQRAFSALEDAGLFFGHGTDNAWDEAVQLVLYASGLPADSDDSVLDTALSGAQSAQVTALLQRRIEEGQPLAYLTGRAWFAGYEFLCDARALVPRSPLGELILGGYGPWWHGAAPERILDLCCGGGCIGIAAALEAPQASVVLADIDPAALALARENIALHDVGGRVSVERSDLFDALGRERFDLILCNPPYVDAGDIAAMPREYRAEPLHALASGADGLDHPLQILAEAPDHLREGGLLFLELGNSWATLDALCPALPLTWVEFSAGGHGVLVATRAELCEWQEHFQALRAERNVAGV